MILGEMFLLSWIYIYVAVCSFCLVRCLIIFRVYWLFSNYSAYVFLIFLCFFLVLYIVFCFIYSVFLYCFVYCFSFCI